MSDVVGAARLAGARRLLWRIGITIVLVAIALKLEAIRVLEVAGRELVGPWESALISSATPGLAILVSLPIIALLAVYGGLIPIVQRRSGRWAWCAAAAIIAGTLAIDLSTGRKAKVLALRVPFVIAMAIAAAAAAFFLLPAAHRAARRRPWIAPVLGAFVCACALTLDARVLPRLYPIFHAALLALAIASIMLIAEGLVAVGRAGRWLAFVLDAIALFGFWQARTAVVYADWAGQGLATSENVRRVLDERSLLFARVVQLAARRWPPPPIDLGDEDPSVDPLADAPSRALSANGRDVLMISIDALRADHVGAYGYARATTPFIDGLAREGTTFEHAYTPTPHTSYAISSLMTGKYLKPILALEAASGGVRRPDETWAGILRAYGFRTAAFYPPAIFYVDAERFADLELRGLDFEYAKVEFAAPDLRAAQLAEYLRDAPAGRPIFCWVHLFEPHEPYVAHAQYPFGDAEIDRYDSEIAATDAGVGAMVDEFRKARPGAIVIVTADHGEAFGEHGARYHGTTVYEEQVRVPLIVSAPGLVASRRVDRPVQLVDLLPTVLSAYGIPRPPRVRGRDLGALMALEEPTEGAGVAFSEVDDMSMLAEGSDRLICSRRIESCRRYDLATDAAQERSLSADDARGRAMRHDLGALIASSARLEGFSSTSASGWPDALRRAFSGDGEAAIEVAPLLDDVSVEYRRRAAEALAKLGRSETSPHVRRALPRERDDLAARWLSIASVRTASSADPESWPTEATLARLAQLLDGPDAELGRWSALAIGGAVDRRTAITPLPLRARAFAILAQWLAELHDDAGLADQMIDALVALHDVEHAARATPGLLAALDDVRLRAKAARALGLLGDHAAAPALAARIAAERHLDARAPEALALARVAHPDVAMASFAWILGVPEPAPGGAAALMEAIAAGSLAPWVQRIARPAAHAVLGLSVPRGTSHRVVVAGPALGATLHAIIAGRAFDGSVGDGGGVIEVGDALGASIGAVVRLDITASEGVITGVAIVARVAELPPPKGDRGAKDGAP